MRSSNQPSSTEQPDSPPREIGPTAGDENVQFNVSLNLPGAMDLAEFLDGLSNPSSSNYHQFLTAAEFGERFGLPQEAVGRVVAWLESGGLEASVVPQRTSVAVTGSAEQVNRLLGIQLVDWQELEGRPLPPTIGCADRSPGPERRGSHDPRVGHGAGTPACAQGVHRGRRHARRPDAGKSLNRL